MDGTHEVIHFQLGRTYLVALSESNAWHPREKNFDIALIGFQSVDGRCCVVDDGLGARSGEKFRGDSFTSCRVIANMPCFAAHSLFREHVLFYFVRMMQRHQTRKK